MIWGVSNGPDIPNYGTYFCCRKCGYCASVLHECTERGCTRAGLLMGGGGGSWREWSSSTAGGSTAIGSTMWSRPRPCGTLCWPSITRRVRCVFCGAT
eukprot:8816386-Pyramimonas_sp.AAC.1